MAAPALVQALDDLEADIDELTYFISIYKAGATTPSLNARLNATIVRITSDPEQRAERQKILDALIPEVRRAAEIEKSGFQYLYGLAVLRLWSSVEAALNDLCRARLEHDGYWRSMEALKGIKTDLHEFLGKSDAEQIAFVLDEVTTARKARFQPGAGRFEGVLNAIGLGGDVPAAVRKRMVWLSEARHVLVHRQGKVDAKFLSRHPDIGQTVGEKLVVKEHQFSRSVAAVRAYAAIVGMRLEEAGLADKRDVRQTTLTSLVDEMAGDDAKLADATEQK